MVRSPGYDRNSLKKGPWTPEEDEKLIDYINRHGHGSWGALPRHAGLNRCGKSCRLRWTNYLRPDIKRGNFSEEEERLIINLHSILGNKWSKIATHLPGRTDNEIKNYWNTHIRKKLLQIGIDPNTHKPRTDLNRLLNVSQLLGATQFCNLKNPWDNTAMLQPDITQLANILLLRDVLQILNTSTLPIVGNPIEGVLNEASTLYTKEPTPTFQHIFNTSVKPQEPSDFHAFTNPWTYCEGGFNPIGLDDNCKSLSSSFDFRADNLLPELVLASNSSETSVFNQMESKADPSNYITGSPTPATFEAWEKLIDNESSASYWKNILDLASSWQSPNQ